MTRADQSRADQPRPDKHRADTLGEATAAVHVGNVRDESTGAIRQSLTLSNSYALPYDPREVDWGVTDQLLYTRTTGANQLSLQAKIAALDHAEDAVALASGVAAMHAVAFALLKSGDHVVVSDQVYEATWNLFADLLPRKWGISATLVPIDDLDAVRAAVRPETVLIIAETIANPTTTIADVPALAGIAADAGALLVIDATFTPPPLIRPLELGADLVVHSLTKYINGHGDAVGGSISGRRELIERIKLEAMVDAGGIISPFNAWLIQRGSVTLPLRIARITETAQRIAEFLDADPRIAWVRYPGLPSHPQAELAARLLPNGSGGMLAFATIGGGDDFNRFVSHLRLVTSATSLGHDESLVVHVGTDSPRFQSYPHPFLVAGSLRFSTGLEDADDLIADLSAALDAAF